MQVWCFGAHTPDVTVWKHAKRKGFFTPKVEEPCMIRISLCRQILRPVFAALPGVPFLDMEGVLLARPRVTPRTVPLTDRLKRFTEQGRVFKLLH